MLRPRLFPFVSLLATSVLVTSSGCFSLDESEPVAPPPANERVVSSDVALVSEPRTMNVTVACDGPAEEVESLNVLCGAGEKDWKLVRTEADGVVGWGIALRDVEWDPEAPTRGLMVFVSHPEGASDRVAEASYSAYVGIPEPAEWEAADVVTRGRVHSEVIGDDSCGPTWIGSAELYWRNTILLASWLVAPDC